MQIERDRKFWHYVVSSLYTVISSPFATLSQDGWDGVRRPLATYETHHDEPDSEPAPSASLPESGAPWRDVEASTEETVAARGVVGSALLRMEIARSCVWLLSVPMCYMLFEIQVASEIKCWKGMVAEQAGLYLEGCGGTVG